MPDDLGSALTDLADAGEELASCEEMVKFAESKVTEATQNHTEKNTKATFAAYKKAVAARNTWMKKLNAARAAWAKALKTLMQRLSEVVERIADLFGRLALLESRGEGEVRVGSRSRRTKRRA